MRILFGLLMTIAGTLMYIKGETKTKLLGNSNKHFKYWMGVPIALIGLLVVSWWSLLCIGTYWLACNSGYGTDNWITKLIGKRWAVTLHGTLVGLASAPIIHYWSILAAVISGVSFYILAILDDKNKIKEPYIAILRGGLSTWML